MNLRREAILAKNILEDETPYLKNRELIYSFFSRNNDCFTQDIVESQLIIIDAYYSTNMSRRYYGIEEIAQALIGLSNSKAELKNRFIGYASVPNKTNELSKVFSQQYGYNKKGNKFGKATSLISKYAYFITDFNFPIYDSIVKEVYPLLVGSKISDNNIDGYISNLNKFLDKSDINNYNELDNLLWLMGKINRGSYSSIISKGKYIELVQKIGDFRSKNSISTDKEIKDYINKNIDDLGDVFSEDLVFMINFCKGIINN